ncbi:hypothetical protein EDC94DRAFT_586165 [Helicostylum pulchrum]|nr:hypothetical protein EDC94DRAFT_586165 [Helicostylum pulchrum]
MSTTYHWSVVVVRFIKLPRMLKDMRDVLLKEIEYDNRSTAIRTCTMVELDRPTAYVSCVSRGKKIEISNKIKKIGSTVLSAILSSWVCCEMVKDVLNLVVNMEFFWHKISSHYRCRQGTNDTIALNASELNCEYPACR